MPTHTEINLDYWAKIFPDPDTSLTSCDLHITSPADLVLFETLRKRQAQLLTSQQIPTDIFVFGLGEPRDTAITKFGGVPHRPASKPWPQHRGRTFTFVAQINFSDSRDIIGPTPGDILLIYALGEDLCTLHFEWTDALLLEKQTKESVPAAGFEVVSCYGERYRSFDFESEESIGMNSTSAYKATKIGGVPPVFGMFNVGDEEAAASELSGFELLNRVVTGRYLCTLGPIQINPDFAFPWVNHPARIGLDEYNESRYAMTLVDMGCLVICLGDDGSVNYWFQTG